MSFNYSDKATSLIGHHAYMLLDGLVYGPRQMTDWLQLKNSQNQTEVVVQATIHWNRDCRTRNQLRRRRVRKRRRRFGRR